ncbi:hypothetical protein CTAYLR_006855 [Chrysophaeum taylorii]|uniref:Mitochondrial fission process protein 1 n=1 Tax=Chrysophaeum taylorii TaxID=2483200 RepID=A0AAD7XHL0_9STRA|nr:hypothetical protein CTAYLR_006855 [Chrysophaeum taylorii]
MEDIDYFRDTPLRLMGYANEVGESFKPLISRSAYLLSYALAGTYVLGDSYDKYERERRADRSDDAALVSGVKALVWQAFASVIIPGFVVNRIVATAGYFTSSTSLSNPAAKRYAPTLVGLASIPFIVKPIDAAVDKMMETYVDPVLDRAVPEGPRCRPPSSSLPE